MNSRAQNLAAQRLARSNDRLRSSQTSSASYGSWFTPTSEAPVRRPLTEQNRKLSQSQQQAALHADRAAVPAATGNGARAPTPSQAPASNSRGSTYMAAAPAVEAEPAEMGASALAMAGQNCRGSINLALSSDDVPDAKSSDLPPVGSKTTAPPGMTLVGAPEVAETASVSYASFSKVHRPPPLPTHARRTPNFRAASSRRIRHPSRRAPPHSLAPLHRAVAGGQPA